MTRDTQAIHQVVMPKLGLTMTRARVVAWHRREGEAVARGEPLFTLESDKAVLDIEAPAAGTLHILVAAGETVPVLTPIATLGAAAPAPAAPDPARNAPAASLVTHHSSRTTDHASRITYRASPKARAIAKSRSIDLSTLPGTGPRGMIVVADLPPASVARATPVARKMAAEAGLDLAAVPPSGPAGRVTGQDVQRALVPTPAPPESAADIQPLTGLRAVIAERLTAGWRERPQVTLTTEADATNLVSARAQVIAELGEKVSYDAFLVLLVARALTEQPWVNARLTPAGVERLPEINIGVAVDTERGLLVPVVRDAARKGLVEVHRLLAGLAARAQAGQSLPDDLAGGTFTITNLGMFEIDAFTPIINPPEAAILGVGRILARPVGVNGQVVLRDTVTLSLSFDHRLLDGGPAARFLQRVKQLVERPVAGFLRRDA